MSRAYTFESVTVSSTAVGLTAANYAEDTDANGRDSTSRVLITVETDQIRFRTDGTDPTASVGHIVNPGQVIELTDRNDIANFKAIRVTTNATLRVTFECGEI